MDKQLRHLRTVVFFIGTLLFTACTTAPAATPTPGTTQQQPTTAAVEPTTAAVTEATIVEPTAAEAPTEAAEETPTEAAATEESTATADDGVSAEGSMTTDVVAAATAFLDTLDDSQREAVLFEFDDEDQRARWSNFPTGIFERAGINLGSMTQEQDDALMTLLSTILSEQGYEKLQGELTADQYLLESGMQQGLTFGRDQYFVSFLGTPSETDPWMLQFGGHHFALNITVVGDQMVLTPSHTGCQPCVPTGDFTLRPLGDETDLGFELINALDTDQQDTAILDYAQSNLVLGPGEVWREMEPEGLPASEMTEAQRDILISLIGEWTNILNEPAAAPALAEIEATLDDTYFAWSGETTSGSAVYFRISGPQVWIEYADQGDGGGGPGGGPPNGTPRAGGPPNGTPGAGGPPNGTPGAGGPPDGTPGTEIAGTPPASTPGAEMEGTPPSGTPQAAGTPSTDASGTATSDNAPTDSTLPNHIHTIYRDPTNEYGILTIEEAEGQ